MAIGRIHILWGEKVRKSLSFACFIAASFCLGAAYVSSGATPVAAASAGSSLVKEEQIVRFAYAKLRWYLAREAEAKGDKALPTKIELSAIAVGNPADIMDRPASDYVSFPRADAETPNVNNAIVKGDDGRGESHVGFSLKWYENTNVTSRNYDRARTVRDLLRVLWGDLRDWASYASYSVRYLGGGHDETYKVLALFAPVKVGEPRFFVEINFNMAGGVHRVVAEERPAMPRHYWRTGTLLRTRGAFGMEGIGGRADTPSCEIENSPTACYGRVCCDDAAGAAECCWRAMPATNEARWGR